MGEVHVCLLTRAREAKLKRAACVQNKSTEGQWLEALCTRLTRSGGEVGEPWLELWGQRRKSGDALRWPCLMLFGQGGGR